jgi:hypothetical protein
MTEARPKALAKMGGAYCPHTTFRRAIARHNLTVARAVARELPIIALADALASPPLEKVSFCSRRSGRSRRFRASRCSRMTGDGQDVGTLNEAGDAVNLRTSVQPGAGVPY